MKAQELKENENYQIDSGIYTYRGLLNEKKGFTKANKVVFWLRESDASSPVVHHLAFRVDFFNNNLAKVTYSL